MHADTVVLCTRRHLLGLQALADQFGVALQNARRYGRPRDGGDVPVQSTSFPPHRSGTDSARPPKKVSRTVAGARAYIHAHYHEPISRGDIAARLNVSENYLTGLFHEEVGVALWTYLSRYRIERAKDLLVETDLKITEVAAQVGFDDPAYFSRVFRRYVGRAPRAFRKLPLLTGSV